MVWGRLVPPADPSSPPTDATGAPRRATVTLVLVGGLSAVLVVGVGLGPSWAVVVVAATGTALAVRIGRGGRRATVFTLLLVGATGLGWIELVNESQYGTLSLSGPPPLVRWCGTTYRPDGVSATTPDAGGGLRYSKILRTPSGRDVFGVAPSGDVGCRSGAPLFVEDGPGRYRVYDPTG